MRVFLGALAVLLIGCSGGPQVGPPACDGCSVVLVTFDTLRADRLGAFGYEKNTSPELDAFARESFVFPRAISQSGSTATSLPSLLTSKYPFVDGVFKPLEMTPGQVTLADVLRGRGYKTAAVIGWKYAGSELGFDQGFDVFDEDYVPDEPAARTRERAVQMIEKLEPPFFLWIHFRPPHYPYEADDDVFASFHESVPGEPTLQSDDLATVQAHFTKTEQLQSYILDGEPVDLTDTMLEQLRALYDGGIRRADEQFGRLVEALDAKAGDRTAVIVASDHGESLGPHGLFDHNYLFHSVLHVPIILRLPSRRHQVLSHPVMNVDIFPTVLTLVGIEHTEAIRGRNLFDAERAGTFQFAEYEDRRALLQGDFKLIVRQTPEGPAPPELYNVQEDPGEFVNLASSRPELVQWFFELSNSLKSLDSAAAPLDDESKTRDALRSLGYVQ